MNLLQEIKHGSKWEGKDDFPSTRRWKTEVEKWLEFLKDEGQFEKFLPRLRDNPSRRNEVFSEISAAYFIQKIKNCSIIEWEPRGENGSIGEFSFNVSGIIIFCEVKSPGWEAEIAKKNKNSPRIRQPKYINGEGRAFNNAVDIRMSVEKAYPKFRKDIINLLIIVDDLFVSLVDDIFGMNEALLGSPYTDNRSNGCFVNSDFNRLSAIASLNVQETGKLKYFWKLYSNPFALLKIPEFFCSGSYIFEVIDLIRGELRD